MADRDPGDVLKHLPEPVFQLDSAGLVTFANPAWVRVTGRSLAASLGRPLTDVIAAPDRVAVGVALGDLTDGAEVRMTVFLAAGARRVELVIRATGRTGWTGMMVDVTARHEAESQLVAARDLAEEASRAKAAFLANMSHEIRTPMNAVIGMTSLLLETPLSEEQLDYVETIRGSGEVLLALINDILDFSKIDSGHMELEVAPFELTAVIESALDLVAGLAAGKGLRFAYHTAPEVPARVRGDGTRLRQILVNLLSNAVKFTEAGEVTLHVALAAERDGRLVLRFAVRDTGIGIEPDRIHRLFRSFSQVDRSTTRLYGGSGLGLAICKRLTQLMGGDIRADSTPGVGSTFTFTIAVERDGTAAPAWRGPRPAVTGHPFVIVDPGPSCRGMTAAMVREWGGEVAEASCAADAARLVAARGGLCTAIAAIEDDDLAELLALTALHPSFTVVIAGMPSRRTHWEPALAAAPRRDSCASIAGPVRWGALALTVDRLLVPSVVEEADASMMASGVIAVPPDLGALRILIAEDNVINQKVAVGLLRRLGCRADVVANGVETLDALRRQTYDIVLLDVQMPEMDGIAAARAINDVYGIQRPVLCAMTANATQDDRRGALEAGMDHFITKPVTSRELERVLRWTLTRIASGGDRPRSRRTLQAPSRVSTAELVRAAALARRLDEVSRDAGADVAREIAAMFVADAPPMAQKVVDAVARGDAAAVRRAAHALRGAAANIGAVGLAQLAEQVEGLAVERRLCDTGGPLGAIERELAATCAALRSHAGAEPRP